MPLSNAQMRDVQSVLHPYTNLDEVPRNRTADPRARPRACASMTRAARIISRRWRGCGARRSAGARTSSPTSPPSRCARWPIGHLFGGSSHEPAIALAEKLKEISPFPVGKVFFANSGSEANDTQIKLYWYAANARGQTEEEEDSLAHQGLSRRDAGERLAHRPCQQSQELRPAVRFRAPCRLPALLSQRRARRERDAVLRSAWPQSRTR